MNPPRRNRGWIWYFVVLGLLTAVAVGVLLTFNLQQQLKPEQVEAARRLWDAKGPANYDMTYTQKGSAPGTFRVEVRNRKPTSVIRDGQLLEERLYRYSDMPALFGFIEDSLRNDAEPGKARTFTVATFDPNDGHLIHYIRRVMGGKERIEITVEFHALSQSTAPLESKKACGSDVGRAILASLGGGIRHADCPLVESFPKVRASSMGHYVPLMGANALTEA
jgi:hypothetical protein